MTDEAQYRRAREVLTGAGWLFDVFVEAEQRAWMQTAPMDHERREHHYHRAHVAAGMKAFLEAIVEGHEADVKLAERKERMKEQRNER